MKRGSKSEGEEGAGRGLFMGEMGISDEERRQAMVGVMTNVAAFAAIILALRLGKGGPGTVTCHTPWGISLGLGVASLKIKLIVCRTAFVTMI